MEYVAPVKPNEMAMVDLAPHHSCSDSIEFTPYYDYNTLTPYLTKSDDIKQIHLLTREYLTNAVSKRLMADRPIGFLLSGGLDSSLIVAIATKLIDPKKIVCFSIGLVGSPDIEAAKKVVNYLGIVNHHVIPFSILTGIKEIPNVIRSIESYDITTIRASTPQYIMAEYIQNKTDIRVLFSGEGSDEIYGSYRYFRDAPTVIDFHRETIRLLEELYMFDNLRTDRTMAAHGLEVRVPFLDFKYVEFIKQLNPALLMHNSEIIEKKIIRDSFVGYLPNEILYRSKEAFSDAVSSNEVNWFKSSSLISVSA